MAPRRPKSAIEAEGIDHSAEFYIQQRTTFNEADLNKREYSKAYQNLHKYVHEKWQEYFRFVKENPHAALQSFTDTDIYNFLYWLVRESHGGIDSCRSLQTYWNVLCLVRCELTGYNNIDPDKKRKAKNGRQQIIKEFGLRTKPKEKPVMRAEDEFECLKTLWTSPEIKFDMEFHRVALALIIQLAGITGNRPKALLTLRYQDVGVALLPDPSGSKWPRLLIEWKFGQTKGYMGEKDANTFPIPDIPNEPCLVLCPHVTLLALAFHRNAFAAPDLTPAGLYELQVLPGQGQQLLPWKEEIQSEYLFPKSVRDSLGIELGSDHLPYDWLRRRLLMIGEVTGIALPVGAYCFRRGNGEALDSSSHISDAQRNLCLQHGPNSAVFQRNYLSHHITADTHAAYRGMAPQTSVMREATGLRRTIDDRRPRYLTCAQEAKAHAHCQVQKLLQQKLELRNLIKMDGRTIKSYEGTPTYREYQDSKRAYEREYEFQKGQLLKDIKRRYNAQQPVVDIQNQIHKVIAPGQKTSLTYIDQSKLHPCRVTAVEALFTFAPSTPQEERARRADAIKALAALCHLQDGQIFPVRRHHRHARLATPVPAPEPSLTLVCRPTQCFLCLGDKKAPPEQRRREFHSRYDLKKHLLRYHAGRHRGKWPLTCPIDREELIHEQHLLRHAHEAHKTPTLTG